jgi:hypothetical protein
VALSTKAAEKESIMKLSEVLRVLHQMQKDTTRLLFEVSVNESETIHKAVAKADLALGNAASLVRQRLSGTQGINGTCAAAGQGGRFGKPSSQKSTPVLEKSAAALQLSASSNGKESAAQVVSVSPEDTVPDDEHRERSGQSSWEYLDTIQHPGDRPNP